MLLPYILYFQNVFYFCSVRVFRLDELSAIHLIFRMIKYRGNIDVSIPSLTPTHRYSYICSICLSTFLSFCHLFPNTGSVVVRKRCVRKFHTNGRLSFGTTKKTPLPRSCRRPYGAGLLFSNGRCVGRESSAPFKRFLVCCKKALARNRGTFVPSDKRHPLPTVS